MSHAVDSNCLSAFPTGQGTPWGIWSTPGASSQWSSVSTDLTEQKATSAHLGQEAGHKACWLPGPGKEHACRKSLGWGYWAVPGEETGSIEAQPFKRRTPALVRLLPLGGYTRSQILSPKHPGVITVVFPSLVQGEMSKLKGSLEAIWSCIPQQFFTKLLSITCQVLETQN